MSIHIVPDKFIFVHNPKCGGSSVRRWMDKHHPEHQGFAIPHEQQRGHPSLDMVFEEHPHLRDYFSELPSFMIVRDPYARAESAKRHHLRGDDILLDRNIFDITKILMRPPARLMSSQKEYQYSDGKKYVKYIFHFEEIFDGDKIIKFEDITIDLNDIWINKNVNYELLTDRDKQTVEDLCSEDFIEYGYKTKW